jgi:hypothetical protein
MSAVRTIPVLFRSLLFLPGLSGSILSRCLAERTNFMLRKDDLVATLTSPLTIASRLSVFCSEGTPQMPGDSAVQVLVVGGLVGRAGEGLLALAVDVELRAGDSFIWIWTFRSF